MALDAQTLSALQEARQTALIVRDFVWITALTPANAAVSVGFWSDIEDVTTSILDVRTGATVARDFIGGGAMLAIASIPQSAGLDFQGVSLKFNREHSAVQTLFLTNNAAAAKCDIYRGVFNTDTHLIVAPPTIRLPGKIDTAKQTIERIGGVDYIDVAVMPTLRELTRTNPDKKSNATQIAMRPGDNWRKYEGKKVPVSWGEYIDAPQPESQGILGWGNFLGFL